MPTQERYLKGLFEGVWWAYNHHSVPEHFDTFVQDCFSIMRSYHESIDVPLAHMVLGLFYKDMKHIKHIVRMSLPDDETCASQVALAQATLSLRQTKNAESLFYLSIWNACVGISTSFDDTFRKIGHVLGLGSVRHAMRHIDTGYYQHVIITQAIYCFMRHSDDYDMMLKATAQSVDSLSVSVIAGGLFGVHHCDDAPFNLDESTQSKIDMLAKKLT